MKKYKEINYQDPNILWFIESENQCKGALYESLKQILEEKNFEKAQAIIDFFNSDYVFLMVLEMV